MKLFEIHKKKNWQICDWLAKWLIMLGFMNLRWLRRSDVGLVCLCFTSRQIIINIMHMLCLHTNFNSLWPIYAIWQHRTGATLVQIMTPGHAQPLYVYISDGRKKSMVFNYNLISSLKLSYITSWSFQWWSNSFWKTQCFQHWQHGLADYSIFSHPYAEVIFSISLFAWLVKSFLWFPLKPVVDFSNNVGRSLLYAPLLDL